MESAKFAVHDVYEFFRRHSRDSFRDIWDRVTAFVNDQMREDGAVTLRLCHYTSPGMSVWVNKTAPDKYSIYIPSGTFDRLYALNYLFMAGVKIEPKQIIRSIRDRVDVCTELPNRLKSVFLPESQIQESDISGLIDDYCDNSVSPTFLNESLRSAAYFLASHEAAHIRFGHFEIRDMLLQGATAGIKVTDATLGLSKLEVFQGMEVHADQEAARSLSAFIDGGIGVRLEKGLDPYAWILNCAVGLALLICLFDWRFRSLDVESDSHYPHPLIRWTLVTAAIGEEMNQEYREAFADIVAVTTQRVGEILNGLLLSELSSGGDNRKKDLFPLCQLNADRSLFGESVLFEYVLRASERGRRIVFLGNTLLHKPELAAEFQLGPEQRWERFMAKVAHYRQRQSNS